MAQFHPALKYGASLRQTLVKLEKMTADEMLSLGNFLMAIALSKSPEPSGGCETVGLYMAAEHFRELLEDVGMGKKKSA